MHNDGCPGWLIPAANAGDRTFLGPGSQLGSCANDTCGAWDGCLANQTSVEATCADLNTQVSRPTCKPDVVEGDWCRLVAVIASFPLMRPTTTRRTAPPLPAAGAKHLHQPGLAGQPGRCVFKFRRGCTGQVCMRGRMLIHAAQSWGVRCRPELMEWLSCTTQPPALPPALLPLPHVQARLPAVQQRAAVPAALLRAEHAVVHGQARGGRPVALFVGRGSGGGRVTARFRAGAWARE